MRTNQYERMSRNATSYKIKEKHIKYLLKIIRKNPTWSIKIIWANMNSKFSDFEVTENHLSRVIRDNNITRKGQGEDITQLQDKENL